jgi:L-galactono-1,4-lactone dehydrogenase
LPNCGTCARRNFYQPENQEDVEAIVADCAAHKRRLRVVGSGLSPNGVGFSEEGMMSMALLDKVLWVDPEQQLVSAAGLGRVEGANA